MSRTRLCPIVLLLLGGCGAGYDPPVKADHTAAAYRTDLARCQREASAKATRIANATPTSAVAALFASDEPERQGVRDCLQAKGYPPA